MARFENKKVSILLNDINNLAANTQNQQKQFKNKFQIKVSDSKNKLRKSLENFNKKVNADIWENSYKLDKTNNNMIRNTQAKYNNSCRNIPKQ